MALSREALYADVRDRVFRLAESEGVGDAGTGAGRARGRAVEGSAAVATSPRRPPPPGSLDDPGHASPLEEPFPRLEPPPPPPRRIGAEVEWIPVDAATGRARRIAGAGGTLAWVRRHADAHGWVEDGEAAVPRFLLPDGGVLFFEPGGQLEYSSVPHGSPSALLATLRVVAASLEESARAAGVRLVTLGLDPVTPLAEVPLQLASPRYVRMDRWLSRWGEAGPLMMRQTASCQVNLDFPDEPLLAWRLLNATAPYLTAMFANSPVREGRPTGEASTRAGIWRALDPGRTGLLAASPEGEAAVEEYLRFALAAPSFLEEGPGAGCPPFGALLEEADYERWRAHLTTLFPDVRPRGYLEVRCIDALPPALYPAPIVLLSGLLHHRPSLHEGVERLGEPDPALLATAGRVGLAHPAIAEGAALLVRLGLEGAAALGPAVVGPADLEAAAAFFEAHTLRGHGPAQPEAA